MATPYNPDTVEMLRLRAERAGMIADNDGRPLSLTVYPIRHWHADGRIDEPRGVNGTPTPVNYSHWPKRPA